MKKWCLLALLPSLSACTQTDWVVYPVDQHVTVQLPMQPQELDLKRMGIDKNPRHRIAKFRGLGVEDDYALYGIVINSAALVHNGTQPGVRDSLYNRGIQTIFRANQGSYLLWRTAFLTSAGNGVEVAVNVRAPETGKRALVFNRMLLVGDRFYSFTFNSKKEQDSLAGAEQRRRFFNSITVKP